MTNPARSKNLLSIIVILVLTNILVLGYFLWFKKSHRKPEPEKERVGISDMLQKEVGFTDEQLTAYRELKDRQRESMRPMFEDMRRAKDSLFRLLSDPNVTDSALNHAGDAIAARQKSLDLQAFQHFKTVRAICKPDQQEKYDSMILRMFRKMGRPQKKDNEKK